MQNNQAHDASASGATENFAVDDDRAGSALAVGPYEVANDDGVSLDALATALAGAKGGGAANDDGPGALAPTGVVPEAANDDDLDVDLPPTPGAATRPHVWLQEDPHVVALRTVLLAWLGRSTREVERRVLAYLLRKAEGNGELPSVDGEVCYKAMIRGGAAGASVMAPGKVARIIVDRFAPAFRLEREETRYTNGDRGRRINLVVAMQRVIAEIRAEGATVPLTTGGTIAWKALADRADVCFYRLRKNKKGRAVVEDAIRAGEVAVGGVHEPVVLMNQVEVEARVEELLAVVRGFDVEGGKVPEATARRGLIDWDYIAALTGKAGPNMKHHPRYRAVVCEIARRRGTLLPGLMLGSDTVASLREAGLAEIRRERTAVGAKSVEAAVANYKSAFDRLVQAAGADASEPSVSLFGEEAFERARTILLAAYSNPRSATNVARLLDWWADFRTARMGAAELPDSFGEALDVLMRRRGVGATAVSRETGCPAHLICVWTSRGGSPNAGHVGYVRSIEDVLGVARGTLGMKASVVFTGWMSGATESWRALNGKVRGLLPPEAMRWPEERLREAVEQVSPLFGCGTSFGKMKAFASRPENALPPFVASVRLEASLDAYVEYKTAAAVFPLVRPLRARWKSESSSEMGRRTLEHPFRFTHAPEPVDGSPIGGLGIDVADQTLAWCAVPPIMLSFLGHRASRLADMIVDDEARGIRYGSSERALLQQLVSLTNPTTGYLVQQPQLRNELVPLDARVVPGRWDDLLKIFGTKEADLLLGEEDVAFAQRDWTAFVGRAHTAFVQAMAYVDDVMEVSRDPIEPVRGFIEAAEPQAEMLGLMFAAERDWRCPRTQPQFYRMDVRDAVMMRIGLLTAFRPSNLAGLTYTGDERGEIRKVGGTWEIAVSYRKFKNYRSSRLFGTRTARRDYHLPLRDEAGLYDLLDLYFGQVLPAMRVEPDCDAAWVTRCGKPTTTDSWRGICRSYGRSYLAYNPVLGTGMPGVIHFNPYCFRHIKASDILKNGVSGNRLEEAAFALQTSEDMIRHHYGVLLPREATRSSQDTTARAISLARKRLQ